MEADARPWIDLQFALPEEATPLARRLARQGGYGPKPGREVYCSEADRLTIYWSGMGERFATLLAEYILDKPVEYQGMLLICGFAGGLSADAAPGSLLIAESVQESTGICLQPDPGLLAVAGSVVISGVAIQRGALLTVNRVQTLAAEKRALATQTGAWALDMETIHAARIAQQHGVPWLAVRVITDGVEDDLPFDFNTMADETGLVKPARVAASALTHPWKIPALLRLGARSSHAAGNLALFLEQLIARLRP